VTIGHYLTFELVIGVLAGTALLLWVLRGRAGRLARGARRPPARDVDYAELEAAEREVREQDPDDDRDWGPGASRGPRR
jgi:hypothetical protein